MTELHDVIERHRQHCSLPIRLPIFCSSILQEEEVDPSGQKPGFTDSPGIFHADALNHTELDSIFSAPSSCTDPGRRRIYTCNVDPLLRNTTLALDFLCQKDAIEPASNTVIVPQASNGGTAYLTGTACSTTAVPVNNSFGQLQVLSFYVKAENEHPMNVQIGN